MRGDDAAGGIDAPIADTAEMVHISSLALLKMLKHGIFGLFLFCHGMPQTTIIHSSTAFYMLSVYIYIYMRCFTMLFFVTQGALVFLWK